MAGCSSSLPVRMISLVESLGIDFALLESRTSCPERTRGVYQCGWNCVHKAATFDFQPHITVRQCTQAVGDYEGGATLHELFKCPNDHGFGFYVHGACRLIEDENRGVL